MLTKWQKEAVIQERWRDCWFWAEDPHTGVGGHQGMFVAPCRIFRRGCELVSRVSSPLPQHQLLQAALCGPVLVVCLSSSEDFVSLCSFFLSALPKPLVDTFL